MPEPVTVGLARARAAKLVARDARDWAAGDTLDVKFEIVLHPPTERAVLVDQAAVIAWVEAWRQLEGSTPDVTISWCERRWANVGSQSVPERCIVRGADAVAAFAGVEARRSWSMLSRRAEHLRAVFAETQLAPAIRTHSRAIGALTDADFAVLVDVVRWLVENPASGFRIRQLPIRGIDTKWLERHRQLVEALHATVTSRHPLGLVAQPPLVRMRFLDPELRPGGIVDITAPIDELAAISIAPTAVFVFENLDTVLSMPPLAGCVVVHGSGYAVSRLARIPWIQSGRIVYWGDLDSDGFAILHALRSGCEDVTSVLMDEATLLAYRDLWVPETRPAAGTYPTLTTSEAATLQHIRSEGDVRLEQERIPWAVALEALITAAGRPEPQEQ